MENFVITIARGYGSGGKEIGLKLAEQLGIECYERRLVKLASRLSGIEEDEFKEIDEKLRKKSFRSLLQKIPVGRDMDAVFHKFVSDDLLFEYQSRIILDLAKKESCIIVGKCADFVLKGHKNVVSVYIEAPRAFTRKRIMAKEQVSADVADYLISTTDKYRADYYEYYTNGNYWTNPVNYDITLNSSTMGIDGCIEMIKRCMELKLGWKPNEKKHQKAQVDDS